MSTPQGGGPAAPIVNLDPALGDDAPGNPPVRDDELGEILASIRDQGQLVPGIACRHPTDPKRHIRAAGHRRARACQILDIPWRAEFHDRVFTPREFIKIRVGENHQRKVMRPFELLADVTAMWETGDFRTWAEVAAELSLSPATMCRVTSLRRFSPDQRAIAEGLAPSVAFLIAPLMPSRREAALAFASAPDAKGKLPTRDALLRHIESTRPKGAGRPPRGFTIKADGYAMTLKPKAGATTEEISKWIASQAAKLRENRHIQPDGIRFVFDAPSTGGGSCSSS